MKVNVKGLVFVGFAATILAGAAKAEGEQNIVTSLAYTEATYQKLSNLAKQNSGTGNTLNSASDTTYPSEKKVYDAIAAVQSNVNGAGYEVTSNRAASINNTMDTATTYPTTGAVITYAQEKVGGTGNGGKVVTAGDTAGQVTYTAINNTGTLESGLNSSTGGDLVTEYTLQQAIAAQATADSTAYTYTGDSATIQIDDNNEVSAITTGGVAQSGTNLVTGGQVYDALHTADSTAAYQAKSNSLSVGNASGGWTAAATTVTNDSGTVPTTAAVKSYVDDQIAALDSAADSAYQPKAGAGIKVGNAGSWDTLQSGSYTSLTADTTNHTVTVDIPASAINNSGTIASGLNSSTGADLVTEYTVQQAIAAQPASGIPAKNTTNCTDDHPCALVAEEDGFHWRVMAVDSTHQTVAAGTCGDAAGTGCNSSI